MANTHPLSARDLMNLRRQLRDSTPEIAPPAPADEDLLGLPGPADAPGPIAERVDPPGHANGQARPPSAAEPTGESELEVLRAQNAELRSVLADLRQLLEEMSHHDPDLLQQRITELEGEVAQKDEGNRQLHAQLEEIEQQFAAVSAPPPRDEDLAALSDELERERCQLAQERKQLEEDRRQLRDDEEHLMKQMREMEVTMARERAEMARQRTELTRLHGEIRHELDAVQRDGALTARLAQFQRKQQEMMARHGLSGVEPVAPSPPPSQPTPAPPKRDSNVLRRLFGPR